MLRRIAIKFAEMLFGFALTCVFVVALALIGCWLGGVWAAHWGCSRDGAQLVGMGISLLVGICLLIAVVEASREP